MFGNRRSDDRLSAPEARYEDVDPEVVILPSQFSPRPIVSLEQPGFPFVAHAMDVMDLKNGRVRPYEDRGKL